MKRSSVGAEISDIRLTRYQNHGEAQTPSDSQRRFVTFVALAGEPSAPNFAKL